MRVLGSFRLRFDLMVVCCVVAVVLHVKCFETLIIACLCEIVCIYVLYVPTWVRLFVCDTFMTANVSGPSWGFD